jgi:hypothetical protein
VTDPIEKLKSFAPEDYKEYLPTEQDVNIQIKPRRDGVFPKVLLISLESTDELIVKQELNKGDSYLFKPPMSGSYVMHIYPKDEMPQD